MKALIVAMFMFSAVSISAVQRPAPVPYCECQGRGIPVGTPTPEKPEAAQHSEAGKGPVRGKLERLFYEWQWYFMVYEHFYMN